MSQTTDQLHRVHADLISLSKGIAAKIEATSDGARKEALFREMMEVGHRITIAGGLLFSARTVDIAAKVTAIDAARQDVEKQIAKFESIKAFIDSVNHLLSIVDGVLDLVKPI